MKQWTENKAADDMNMLKDWVRYSIRENRNEHQGKDRQYLSKKLQEVKDMFNVPGIIGPYDTLMQKQGVKKPDFPDFSSYVRHMCEADGASLQLREEYD